MIGAKWALVVVICLLFFLIILGIEKKCLKKSRYSAEAQAWAATINRKFLASQILPLFKKFAKKSVFRNLYSNNDQQKYMFSTIKSRKQSLVFPFSLVGFLNEFCSVFVNVLVRFWSIIFAPIFNQQILERRRIRRQLNAILAVSISHVYVSVGLRNKRVRL